MAMVSPKDKACVFAAACLGLLILLEYTLVYYQAVQDVKSLILSLVDPTFNRLTAYLSSYVPYAYGNSNSSAQEEINNKLEERMPPSNSDGAVNWNLYRGPMDSFKFSFPGEWKKITNGNNITFISPPSANQSSSANIKINVAQSGNVPLYESVSLAIIRDKQSKSNFNLSDFGYTSMAGNQAYGLLYSYKEGTDIHKVLDISTTVGGKLYSFIFTSKFNQFENFLPIASKMINSLDIKELPNESKSNPTHLPEMKAARDPYDMAVDPITDKAYVVNFRSHSLSVLDALTNKLLKEIKVGRFPLAVSVNPDAGTLYVANSRSNTVSVIDSSTDKVVKEIPVGNKPVAVVVDGTEKGIDSVAFVANVESNSISVIDATRNEIFVPNLLVGKEPSDLAVNDVINRLYVANRGSNDVSVVDYYITNDGKFKNTTTNTIKVQEYPTAIAINPDTNKIYVANYYSNTVSVIDGSNNSVIDTIAVGTNPSSIAINAASNILYVTNYGDNTVSVIDGDSDKILKNIDVGSFPNKAYYNPLTDIISVMNVGSQTISEIKDTSLLAGVTFKVSPANSGNLNCNGKSISDLVYERFNVGEKITCNAKPSSDYVFRSWSSNLPTKAEASSMTSFNSTDYGNVTANFQVPVEVTLPKAYWEQLYLVLISILVPAVVGWSIPAIAGYFNSLKQRKVLRIIMQKIIQINNDIHEEKQRRSAFEMVKNDIVDKLTDGKISESQYDILSNKISENLQKRNRND